MQSTKTLNMHCAISIPLHLLPRFPRINILYCLQKQSKCPGNCKYFTIPITSIKLLHLILEDFRTSILFIRNRCLIFASENMVAITLKHSSNLSFPGFLMHIILSVYIILKAIENFHKCNLGSLINHKRHVHGNIKNHPKTRQLR